MTMTGRNKRQSSDVLVSKFDSRGKPGWDWRDGTSRGVCCGANLLYCGPRLSKLVSVLGAAFNKPCLPSYPPVFTPHSHVDVMPACSIMEEIVFSPELTVPDTWVLQNLADDIQRHRELKGASKIDRDEGYSSANSNAKESVSSAWVPYLGSYCELLLRTR